MLYTLQMYIRTKGGAAVAREVGVSEGAVSQWLHFANAPRPHQAHKLIQVTNGILTWEGVYLPFVEHNNQEQIEMDFGEEPKAKKK